MQSMAARYGISYLDMFNYGSSSIGPEFESSGEAIAHARRVLDGYLEDTYKPGMTPKDLFDSFMIFGEDVVIAAIDGAPPVAFSSLRYVRQRCAQLCSR